MRLADDTGLLAQLGAGGSGSSNSLLRYAEDVLCALSRSAVAPGCWRSLAAAPCSPARLQPTIAPVGWPTACRGRKPHGHGVM